jgi:hypothetical protein
VSEKLEQAMRTLARDLESALGDRLVSLVLYGSLARGAHVPGRSDVNLLLIVTDAAPATLRLAAPALAAWSKAGHAPPLIHTPVEWAASADVYPLEIEDIREAHRVLAGRDPVEGLSTRREDQARELEHHARGVLLRLRGRYSAAAGDGRALARLLLEAAGPVVVCGRAALRLAGRAVPAEPSAVAVEVAALAGFDATGLVWACQARAESGTPRLEPDDARAASFLAGVERLVGWVNDASDKEQLQGRNPT